MHFRTRTHSDDIETALQETLQKFQHQTNLPTHFDMSGDGLPLPPDVQVHVLHIVQEALSNVRKHAGATSVTLTVIKGRQWVFQVSDDGAGFNTTQTKGESHVGLKIMRERAHRIAAAVHVTSEHGRGTQVRLTLPDMASMGKPGPASPVGHPTHHTAHTP